MGESINISDLKGIMKFIASACDKDKNGKLETTDKFDEISLFYNELDKYNAHFKPSKSSIFNDKYIAPKDNIRVDTPMVCEVFGLEKNTPLVTTKAIDKTSLCQKMQEKWCSIFKQSPLTPEFFSKLYDVIDVLKVKVPEDKWDKEKYDSPEEQAFDEVIAIFAGEAQLNPKTIGKVRGADTFYGLFQLSQQGLETAKKWAEKHPDEPGMNNIKSGMTLTAFRNLKGEQQLDYLIAYIGASREGSKISPDEELTPAKLWSMIKLPNLDENNPQKKARRDKTIAQKQDSIQAIFKNNKIPFGTA